MLIKAGDKTGFERFINVTPLDGVVFVAGNSFQSEENDVSEPVHFGSGNVQFPYSWTMEQRRTWRFENMAAGPETAPALANAIKDLEDTDGHLIGNMMEYPSRFTRGLAA